MSERCAEYEIKKTKEFYPQELIGKKVRRKTARGWIMGTIADARTTRKGEIVVRMCTPRVYKSWIPLSELILLDEEE